MSYDSFPLILPRTSDDFHAHTIRVLVVPEDDDPYGVDVRSSERSLSCLVGGRAEVVPTCGHDENGTFVFLTFVNAEVQDTGAVNAHTETFGLSGIRGTAVVAGYDSSSRHPTSCPEAIVAEVAWDFLIRHENDPGFSVAAHAWRGFEAHGWS